MRAWSVPRPRRCPPGMGSGADRSPHTSAQVLLTYRGYFGTHILESSDSRILPGTTGFLATFCSIAFAATAIAISLHTVRSSSHRKGSVLNN